jgi:hypothetical protein
MRFETNTIIYYCECGDCTTYFDVKNDTIKSYGIHIKYKDKSYAALFHPENEFTLERWVEEITNPGDWEKNKIIALKFHPNITPQNFLRRLPTLLTFS